MPFCDFLISSKLVFGASVATILTISYRNWKRNAIPNKWKLVGEISELFCFPIKSAGVIKLNEIQCTSIGAKDQFLRDRSFMVINSDEKRFVTARQHPMLVKITPQIIGSKLTLSAPDKTSINVDMFRVLSDNDTLIAEIWDKAYVEVFDCGDKVAEWISDFILHEKKGLRLVYYPLNYPTRPIRPKNRVFPEMSPDHVGALHDATSFMMINESSVDDLNSRLNFNVKPVLFRSNFVMKGPKAFEEDNYKWVKIGDETIMKVVKPCLRCLFTNVDPDTGKKREDGEPLNTLKKYRKFPQYGDAPFFGIHLGVIKAGTVKIGDQVFISH
uniref:CSON010423 protein n=1 Tax=Culicoides sonorensis TaxID=179676 RepID=A0A336M721_CULSO